MNEKHSSRSARLCLVLAGILFLSALSCGLPTMIGSGTPTPPPAPTNTRPATLPPPPPPPGVTATDVPTAAPEIGEVQIFLVAVGDGGSSGKPVGCGDSLVPVKRPITPTRQPIKAALDELFAIKEQFFGQSGLFNALYQSNLQVESAEVDENRIATVVLTGQVMMGGECDTPRVKGQIEQTILAVGGIQSANILLNGQTIDEALSLK